MNTICTFIFEIRINFILKSLYQSHINSIHLYQSHIDSIYLY